MSAKKLMGLILAPSVAALVAVTSCAGMLEPDPRVARPAAADVNEVHWRIYYEDQFDTYGKAMPPVAGDPDVAWTAYYSEKNAYAIRENNRLLKEELESR